MEPSIAELLTRAAQSLAAGELSQAEQLYRAILDRQPDHGIALHSLGVFAQQRGDPVSAIHYFNQLVTCYPTSASSWNNLGGVQVTAGRFDAAVTSFEQALRLRPDFAEAFNNLGVARQYQREWPRAIAAHRQAIFLRPDYALAYDNLGTALKNHGQREEAEVAYQRALALKPDFAEACNNLGILLQEQGELARARDCYQQALRLRPGFADASNNLATVLKEQGWLDEAAAQYQKTLQLDPDHALACYNLSQFAGEGRAHFRAGEMERIKAYLTAGKGSAQERSLFCFTLAELLNQQGAADEAFGYYRQANELYRGILRERNQAFDGQCQRALVDRVIAAHDPALFQRTQGWGCASQRPVFVVGMPRSGTTLVEQILASHPLVFGAGETGELTRLLNREAQGNTSPAFQPIAELLPSSAAAQELAGHYLQRLARLNAAAERIIDKTLENYLYLGLIAVVFPRARIIHCLRQPLDVCLSCYFQNFQNVNFASSLEDIGTFYREHERLLAHWRQVLPSSIHEVRYEELIRQPETAIRGLLDFCGLSWDDRCLAFHQQRRNVRTASCLQVRKPLSARSIGRWKHYRSHLGPLLQVLGETLPD